MTAPPLHALVVIDGLGWGGAEMLLAHLASGAHSARLQLSVVYLFEKDGSPAADRMRQQGVAPVWLPVQRLVSPTSLQRLRRHLSQLRPDIVHTHLGYADMLGGTAARTLGIPSVSSIHLSQWDSTSLRDATKLSLAAGVRRHCAARVVAVSEAAREAYVDRGWDRPERVVTVHNGVVDSARPSTGAQARAQLGIPPDAVVLAMVSVVRPGKGHEAALEALALLRRRHAHVYLLIIGDGPSHRSVAHEAARQGDAVLMLGHRDDIMVLLDAVDVLVHPSSHDAFPTSLLEAMAASVPVVATCVGGIPEIVVEGSTGLLVEAPATGASLATALERLVTDVELRRRLGQAARRRFLEHFSAAQWAVRLRVLYDQVLAEGRGPAPISRSSTGPR